MASKTKKSPSKEGRIYNIKNFLLNYWYHTPDTHINYLVAIIGVIGTIMIHINPFKTFIC